VRSLIDWSIDNSVREYEELGIATALAIISTCAQGTYLTPQGRALSLTQLCLMPAAAGKDHYLRCVQDTLRQVDSRLILTNPGSTLGLRGELYCWNSRIWIADEVQDLLYKLTNTDNTYVSGLLDDIKTISNGLDVLPGQALKRETVPEVLNPKLTFIGFGTPGRFKEVITGSNSGGGFLSRLLLWSSGIPSDRQFRRRNPLDPEPIGKLRSIFYAGYTETGATGGIPAFRDALKAFQEGKATVHIAQTDAKIRLSMSEEASHDYHLHDRTWEIAFQQDPDSAEGSIRDRIPQNAMRIASLHALGCGRTEISVDDMAWGCDIASLQGETLAKIAKDWITDSAQERERMRVIEALKRAGGKRSRQELARGLRLGRRAMDEILADLSVRGQVVVKGPSGTPAEPKNGSYPNHSTVHLDLSVDI
jgi:hypothetical protein